MPEALSLQFSPAFEDAAQDTILPPVCVIGAALWRMEQQVQEALREVSIPADCPANHLFIPPDLRSAVLKGGHASRVNQDLESSV